MTVWLALAVFPREPRWDAHGDRSDDTFVDGMAATADVAKGYARTCCAETPPRWFRMQDGGWVYCRLKERGQPLSETHFHIVTEHEVATEVEANGWPRR